MWQLYIKQDYLFRTDRAITYQLNAHDCAQTPGVNHRRLGQGCHTSLILVSDTPNLATLIEESVVPKSDTLTVAAIIRSFSFRSIHHGKFQIIEFKNYVEGI